MDCPVELQGGVIEQPDVAITASGPAEGTSAPLVISDSGSSTEVDEDDDDSDLGQGSAQAPHRLPATWAFSQRVVDGLASAPSAAQGTLIQRRLRYLEMHEKTCFMMVLCNFDGMHTDWKC